MFEVGQVVAVRNETEEDHPGKVVAVSGDEVIVRVYVEFHPPVTIICDQEGREAPGVPQTVFAISSAP